MAFPLDIVVNNSVLQLVVKGTNFNAFDCQNTLYGIYQTGVTPTPGGLTLDVLVKNFQSAYGLFWAPFMSTFSSIDSTTGRVVVKFIPTGGTKFKVQAGQVWTDSSVVNGEVAGDPLPDFAAYTVEKALSVAGRGRNGGLRMWGVPEANSSGTALTPAVHTALQSALDTKNNTFLVGGVGNTDFIELRVVNGGAINTAVPPGSLSPSLALQRIFQDKLGFFVGSQITRKVGRRRRHISGATLARTREARAAQSLAQAAARAGS